MKGTAVFFPRVTNWRFPPGYRMHGKALDCLHVNARLLNPSSEGYGTYVQSKWLSLIHRDILYILQQ